MKIKELEDKNMPIFEYRCEKCGYTFEKYSALQEASGPECPQCGGKKTEKVFSLFSSQCGAPSAGTVGGCGGSGGFS